MILIKKEYTLDEIEEAIGELGLSFAGYDQVENTDVDDYQFYVSRWCIYIPELSIYLRDGVFSLWYEEENDYLPDFCVTVVYLNKDDINNWEYWEQDGFVITLLNYFGGQKSWVGLSDSKCQIILPDDFEVNE